jgi:Uma2 family endonuclease
MNVKLSAAEEDDAPTILQPDLVVCCDPQKLVPEGIAGAPDLVVEVISPASGIADRKWKFELYERFGVPEYWIVDPVARVLEVYQSEEAKRYRRSGAYGPEETVTPGCLPELKVELSLVFREDE